MENAYDYVELYLDSKDSVQYNVALGGFDRDNALFRFETPFENIAGFKVLEAEIPFSYFVINQQTFTLTETGNPPAQVFFAAGNYTATQLATYLGTQLSAASPTASTYTVTFSPTTGRFTITSTFFGGFSLSNMTDRLTTALGTYNGALSVGNTYICGRVAELTGPNYIYINSLKLGPVVKTRLAQSAPNGFGQGRGPQIAKIPMTVNFNEVSHYIDPMPTKWFDLENLLTLDSLDLYCTLGRENDYIRFNGPSFSLKIGFYLTKPNSSTFRM